MSAEIDEEKQSLKILQVFKNHLLLKYKTKNVLLLPIKKLFLKEKERKERTKIVIFMFRIKNKGGEMNNFNTLSYFRSPLLF